MYNAFIMKKFLLILILTLCICNSVSAKILFVPLDSRPACKNFAVDIGRIAGLELLVPPHEMLDYFTVAGESKLLRKWLLDNAKDSDEIIISIDQILHGGLIAARESEINDTDIDELITFLKELKSNNPAIPIYAFSILPRMNPQSTIDNYYQRQALMQYSRLIGRMYAGQQIDENVLYELNTIIEPQNMRRYNLHFENNFKLNKRLIKLVDDKVIDRLILGCDDAEPYSLQSVEVSKLKCSNQITHGADEIAMTLTAQIAVKDFKPKICVMYNNNRTAHLIMPYMASTIQTVVNEKIRQINGMIVDSPDLADFTLFISVNDSKYMTRRSLQADSKRIAELIARNKKVALVDLSMHFDKSEMLLPVLLAQKVNVNSLAAYSGWNTASNSIGTALAQAVTFCSSLKNMQTTEDVLQVYKNNLTFLNQRFVEDYLYLKDTIDTVNHALTKSGSYDTSYLDLGTEYEFATFVLRSAMNKKINDYKQTTSFSNPIMIDSKHKIELKDLSVETLRFPWNRTFEIELKLSPTFIIS